MGSSGAGISAQAENRANSVSSAPRASRGSRGSRNSVDAGPEVADTPGSATVAVGGYPGSVADAGLGRQDSADFERVANSSPSARERWETRGVDSASETETEADANAALTQTHRLPRKSPLEAATTVTTTVRTHSRKHDERENDGILRGPKSPRSPRSPRGQRSPRTRSLGRSADEDLWKSEKVGGGNSPTAAFQSPASPRIRPLGNSTEQAVSAPVPQSTYDVKTVRDTVQRP